MEVTNETMLMIQLSDHILEIVDNQNTLTCGNLQHAIDAVIIAAYQEGEHAAMRRPRPDYR
jgi:hypothetical protein